DLEHASAGFFRNSLQHLLAILVPLLRVAAAACAGTSHSAPTTAPSTMSAPIESAEVARLFTFEINAIDDRVCPLRRFDRARKRGLAAPIVAVGKQDESFASLLFLH